MVAAVCSLFAQQCVCYLWQVCLEADTAAKQSYSLDQLGPLDPITSRSGGYLRMAVARSPSPT